MPADEAGSHTRARQGQVRAGDDQFRNVRAFAQRSGLARWFASVAPWTQNQVVKSYTKEVGIAKKEGRRTSAASRLTRRSSLPPPATATRGAVVSCGTGPMSSMRRAPAAAF